MHSDFKSGRFALTGWFAKFFANDVHVPRCFNPNPNSIGSDANDRDRHVVTDQNLFAWLSREHKHFGHPFLCSKTFPVFRTANRVDRPSFVTRRVSHCIRLLRRHSRHHTNTARTLSSTGLRCQKDNSCEIGMSSASGRFRKFLDH